MIRLAVVVLMNVRRLSRRPARSRREVEVVTRVCSGPSAEVVGLANVDRLVELNGTSAVSRVVELVRFGSWWWWPPAIASGKNPKRQRMLTVRSTMPQQHFQLVVL